MSNLAANECRRQLRYNFTDPERIEKAKSLAEALNRAAATEAELSRIKSDYKARLESIQAEVDLYNSAVLSGYELREYLCRWSYDEPHKGRKTLRKTEGGEIVAVEDMTERDRQMVMEIIEAQTAVSSAPAGTLVLPSPSHWPASVEDFDGIEPAREDDWITDLIRDLFTDVDETILPPGTVLGNLAREVATMAEHEVAEICHFIHAHSLGAEPGWEQVLTYCQSVVDAQRAARSAESLRQAEQKKKSRGGRRASGPGTVDVPSDAGTRDDAGAESKNNL
jgi:hypothetical protein